MSSSDDDFSLFASVPKREAAASSGGDGEDEPDWMKEHKPASARKESVIKLDVTSSDDEGLGFTEGEATTYTRKAPPKRAAAAAAAKKASSFSFTSSDDDSDDDVPIGKGKQKSQQGKSEAESALPVAKGSTKPSKGTPAAAKSSKGTPAKAKAAAGSSKVAPAAEASGAAAVAVDSSQATADTKAAGSQGADGIKKGEVPVMLPEKLARNKVLVELEDRTGPGELGSADLSGDSGAVGRLIASMPEAAAAAATGGEGPSHQLHVDLKGALYAATLVPLPGTLCVVSVGPTEAKVEAMVSSFLQLRAESTLAMAEALMEGDLGDFMDDDDVYFAPAEAEGKAGAAGGEDKAAGAKGAKGKAAKAKIKPKPKAKPKAKPGKAKPKPGKGGGPGVSKGGVSKRKLGK